MSVKCERSGGYWRQGLLGVTMISTDIGIPDTALLAGSMMYMDGCLRVWWMI